MDNIYIYIYVVNEGKVRKSTLPITSPTPLKACHLNIYNAERIKKLEMGKINQDRTNKFNKGHQSKNNNFALITDNEDITF